MIGVGGPNRCARGAGNWGHPSLPPPRLFLSAFYSFLVRGLPWQPSFKRCCTQPAFPGETLMLHRGHHEPSLGSITGLHLAAAVCSSISVFNWAWRMI